MRDFRLLRQLAAASLAAALLLTPAMAAFPDVPQEHPYYVPITKWSEEYHLLNGYEDQTFRPENPITRGEYAGILNRAMKYPDTDRTGVFPDIEGDYWEQAIMNLNAADVYRGSDGKALPKDSITREQAVTMLARAFQMECPEDGEIPYWDRDQISQYARASVAAMTAKNYLTVDLEGNFRPKDPITRAEFIDILNNMIQVLIQERTIYVEDVTGTVMINSPEGATLENLTVSGDLLIAPGVQKAVKLTNVKVEGKIVNFSGVEPEILEEDPNAQEKQPILPEEVYQPGKTTGETFTYSGNQIPYYEGVEKLRVKDGDFRWAEDFKPMKGFQNNMVTPRLEYVGEEFKTQFGIDVSAFQNTATEGNKLDWEAVRNDGVDFAIIRAALRGYSAGALREDVYFRENIRGAQEAGLEVGAYIFSQAITVEEAIEEADFVLNILREEGIKDCLVAYDWEMHDSTYRVYGTPPEMATACAVAFCQRIEEAGYQPMIYASKYVNYMKYDQGAINQYPRWYPEYKGETSKELFPSIVYQMDYWQFSSNCQIDGIGGRVDSNIRFLR